jgi:hypothetical protein
MDTVCMDKNKLIALIFEDSAYTEMLTVEARKDLFLHHLATIEHPTDERKAVQAGRLYNIGKQFGVSQAQETARKFIGGVSKTTMDRRLWTAREEGLVPKK